MTGVQTCALPISYVNPDEAAPAPRMDRMVSHQRTIAANDQPACTSAGCTTKDCTAAGGLPCSCGECQAQRERCERGWWGSADYLMAWTKGRYVPALVTTSAPLDEGVLIPGNSTRVLYGDDENGTNMRSGGRIFAGIMLGLAFYFLNQLSAHLGLLNEWPAQASALLPTVVFLLLATVMLWRQERR